MPKKPKLTTRQRRKAAYDAADAGNPKPLKSIGMKPLPAHMKGPAKGKGGVGRPRTGNKAVEMDRKTGITELGKSHAHLDHAYNRFLEGIPEPELHTMMATVPGPQDLKKNKFMQALNFITAPYNKKALRRGTGLPGEWSMAACLKHCGITLPELMQEYGRYRTAQAIRIAMDRSPIIITHAADDAENRKVVCPRCDGFGTLDLDMKEDEPKRKKATIRTCPECEGVGRVTQSGDAEARKLVLEVAGIAGKKGPVVDARSVHYGHGVFSVESLVKGMEQMETPLLDDPNIIEAEEVKDDAEVS